MPRNVHAIHDQRSEKFAKIKSSTVLDKISFKQSVRYSKLHKYSSLGSISITMSKKDYLLIRFHSKIIKTHLFFNSYKYYFIKISN
jgi:hypothetical protein